MYYDNKRYEVNDQKQWVHTNSHHKMCNDTQIELETVYGA